jgi:hypothetical protein
LCNPLLEGGHFCPFIRADLASNVCDSVGRLRPLGLTPLHLRCAVSFAPRFALRAFGLSTHRYGGENHPFACEVLYQLARPSSPPAPSIFKPDRLTGEIGRIVVENVDTESKKMSILNRHPGRSPCFSMEDQRSTAPATCARGRKVHSRMALNIL